MRHLVLASLFAASLASACTSTSSPSPDASSHGAPDAAAAAPDAAAGTPDAVGACADLAGTWHYTGSCGTDTCVVTQTGCTTGLSCSGGAASYSGSVSGNQFQYQGTTAGGTPASCSGTATGDMMSGACTVQGVPCTFSGTRL